MFSPPRMINLLATPEQDDPSLAIERPRSPVGSSDTGAGAPR